MRCEDYPCCGHTDGLPCNWTPPTFENPEDMYEPGSQEYWDARWEREEAEDEDDEDDFFYAEEPEDLWLDGSYEE